MSEILSCSTNVEIVQWMKNVKLLRRNAPLCDNGVHGSHIRMKLYTASHVSDGYKYRCTKCGRSKSIRCGSFFTDVKIDLIAFMKQVLVYWALDVKHADIAKLTQISTNTIVKYCQGIRAMLYLDLDYENIKVRIFLILLLIPFSFYHSIDSACFSWVVMG